MSKELLFSVTKKDLEIEYFSGTGAGGQHRNKHQNCVRMKHPASGAMVTGQSNRERQANIREAFINLKNNAKFKMWHAGMVQQHLSGKSVKQRVEESMRPSNIRTECKHGKRWVECGEV